MVEGEVDGERRNMRLRSRHHRCNYPIEVETQAEELTIQQNSCPYTFPSIERRQEHSNAGVYLGDARS